MLLEVAVQRKQGNTHHSISRNLTMSLVLVVAAVSAVIVFINSWVLSQRTKAYLEQKADEYVLHLLDSVELPMWNLDEQSIVKTATAYIESELVSKVRIMESNGHVIFERAQSEEEDVIERTAGITHEDQIIGYVEIGLSPRLYKESNRQLLWSSIFIILITLSVLIGLTGVLLRIFLKSPLDDLIRGIGLIAGGNYDYKFLQAEQTEIKAIISSFENMVKQVRDREASLNKINRELEHEIVVRKRAEEALRQSEQKLRSLVEQSPDAIVLADERGSIIEWNPAAEEMTGAKQAEVLGRPLWDVQFQMVLEQRRHPALYEQIKTMMLDMFRTGQAPWLNQLQERQIQRFDGTRRSIQLVGFVIPTKLGFQAGSIIRDTTEQKQTEEEMQRLRSLLSNIINSMPSVLVGIDPQGKVTQWNREAEKVTGITASKAQGRLLSEVFPQLAREEEKVYQAIQERGPHKDEKIVWRSNGKTRYVDIIVYPLVANDIEGAVIRVDDVTERVRLEEMMIQSEKMMTVGGLAAGMAHEINNPLGIILQGIQNTLRRLSPEMKKNREIAEECGAELERIRTYLAKRNIFHYLDGMQEAGLRASKIVANMLNFSRPGESTMTLVNLNQLLENMIELAATDYDLERQYDFRHIEIFREYDEMLPEILCILSEIEQVILNLLRNAAQAIVEKQEEGYTPYLRICTRKEETHVSITIEDNGSGMDAETRKHIFEPFYTTKTVGIGTGLGLSVSYFIITTKHKGTISVDSILGKGTKFTIRLPLLREAQHGEQ